MLSVLLIAREGAGAQALQRIRRAGHAVAATVTADEAANPVRRAALDLGVPVWGEEVAKHPGFAEAVRRIGVDLLLNVHSLAVLPAEVLDAPRIGSFNLHPGPLPGYAGLNAPSWAIYHGETTHGSTLHWMDARIDAGEIAYEARFPVEERDTGLTLSLKCARAGMSLLDRLLAAASEDARSVPRLPQDPSRRRYFGRRVPQEGRLDWSRTAREVVDFVRACDYHPFPSPWDAPATRVAGRELRVLRAARTHVPCGAPPGSVGRSEGGAAWIAAADEWVRVTRVSLGGVATDAAAALPTPVQA